MTRVSDPILSVEALIAGHDDGVVEWHRDTAGAELRLVDDPAGDLAPRGLAAAIGEEHLVNIRLWHAEDEARRPDVDDATIADTKRRIDALNQRRNDLVERIDEELHSLIEAAGAGDPGDVPLHSETPGAIVDRLSILALKIFHMREEVERDDAAEDHRARSASRLAILEEQRADLAACLASLLQDLVAGRRRFRIYRQFKMYNDPETNPAVRNAMEREAR